MASSNNTQSTEDYARIEQAILFLEENFRRQPSLSEIAGSINLSEYHFQRMFTRWAGISPKRFLQFLTLEYAKELLAESNNLLDVTYETGLSSPGRLHDLFVACEAITPGEYKAQGSGLTISYGFHASPFGECLLALTDRGIAALSFVQAGHARQALAELQRNWPQVVFREDAIQTDPIVEQIFAPRSDQANGTPLKLYLKGTNFQLKVWQALLQIPAGTIVSYDTVAHMIGQPGAARAIGRAVATNPVGYLIPCHRVIRKVGAIGDYHWGPARKKAIIGWEAARRHNRIAPVTVTPASWQAAPA
ncbi:MAG TPA: bifunctional helix-turn-helix domain-containing protein/methylated-DNA--[protein]-cysteine S-methyltransferase [Anaerolineae bacterium]